MSTSCNEAIHLKECDSDVAKDVSLWIRDANTPWDVYMHGITRVLVQQRTKYQDMVIGETGAYGKALILDGNWNVSTVDEFIYHESIVHPAMILHGKPEKVLILGGGDGGALREVLRWDTVKRSVVVDIDGDVVEACKRHMPEVHQGSFDDPRAHVRIEDAVDFLASPPEKEWDIVISDLCDPLEDGPAFPLFTLETFQKVQQVLSPKGVLVLQSGSISPPELPLHTRLVRTLQSCFPYVRSYAVTVPTYGPPWSFILASNNPIFPHIDVDVVNQAMRERIRGASQLRYIDGSALLGILQLPVYVREAIQKEKRAPYTMSDPPRYYTPSTN
eukprot:TRINITY_DN73_c0_g1_i3.p1 TRINITY_DN73_c0_g1~~TRINITY_DN73_c0_g1_i3.p1  ORF type:complete len:387 (+),score=68.78 TRINITY_DN73_c0_g1_i3:169-1161(+)